MAGDSLVHTDDRSSLTEAINRVVFRDRGNTSYPAKVIWRADQSDYILDADNAAGKHANFGSGVLTVQDSGVAATVDVSTTGNLGVSGNATVQGNTALGNQDADTATVIGVTTFKNAASTLVQLLVDAGNNRVIVGSTTSLTGATAPNLQVIGRLYVAPESANDTAFQIRRSSAATVGWTIGVENAPVNLAFKDDSDTKVFALGDAASTLQAVVTGGFQATGKSFVGLVATNAFQTQGLTISQGADDDEILTLKSSDIAHGMTALTETDTWMSITKFSGFNGGAKITGYADANTIGINLLGIGPVDDTARSISAIGYVTVNTGKTSGTTVAGVGANANLFVVQSTGAARFLVDAEGDIHMDATSNINAWDEHDDVALLEAFRLATAPGVETNYRRRFSEDVAEHARVLGATGVLTLNEDGRHFVSMKGLLGLVIDAIRQQAGRVADLDARLAMLGDGGTNG